MKVLSSSEKNWLLFRFIAQANEHFFICLVHWILLVPTIQGYKLQAKDKEGAQPFVDSH